MRTKTTIQLILAVLLGLSLTRPAQAEYQASDYLPLEVGNSWTYSHKYRDIIREAEEGYRNQWPAFWAQAPERPQFTIEVLYTEELDGQTYYVISEMPAWWPPAPPHFIAGKKLRWSGTQLMEHSGSSEQGLYRFDGADETGYTVTTDAGDERVTVKAGLNPVPWHAFSFRGDGYGKGLQACNFLAGYGTSSCGRRISGGDYPLFINQLKSLRAVLGGTTVEYEDALVPTSTSSSSWGAVKRSLLARRAGEGTGR